MCVSVMSLFNMVFSHFLSGFSYYYGVVERGSNKRSREDYDCYDERKRRQIENPCKRRCLIKSPLVMSLLAFRSSFVRCAMCVRFLTYCRFV